jgi:hypothetical protein
MNGISGGGIFLSDKRQKELQYDNQYGTLPQRMQKGHAQRAE